MYARSLKVHIFLEGHTFFVDLSYVVMVKSTVEILQNFVASSEYINFKKVEVNGLTYGVFVIFKH